MMDNANTLLDYLTALGVVVTALGMWRMNAKLDRFTGRVEAIETAQNAHVNAPGMHGQQIVLPAMAAGTARAAVKVQETDG